MIELDRNLLVDMGNSSLKWGRVSGGQLVDVNKESYNEAQIEKILDQQWGSLSAPEAIWISSVAPKTILEHVSAWVEQNWQKKCGVMNVESSACGVRCVYEQPEALGVDRWAAIIGAYHLHPEGACILDCGTAITLDVVDSSGQHLGGYILPGFELMKKGLLENTAIKDLPAPQITSEWGDSTASSIYLGGRKAVAALVEASVERLQAAGVCDPALVLTGSAAREVEPFIEIECQHRPNLVLEGLWEYAKEKCQ